MRKLKRDGHSHGIATETAMKCISGRREKSSRGSDSPRRPTRSDLRNFIASSVGRLRNSPERTFQRLGTQTESVTNTATESSQRNAFVVSREKSSRGSNSPRRPTRSGLRNFIASSVGRLRNSPERTFQRLESQTDASRNLKTFEREFDSPTWAAD